jgi:outer membrane protein assembly factor BamE
MRSLIRAAALASASLAVAGCGEYWNKLRVPDKLRVPGLTPYKMEVQQGNSVTQEMVSQLKPGMTKDQVRFVLGTPLISDIFHANRWDYVYWREQSDGKREQRKLAVFFKEDRLSHLDGDVRVAEDKPAAAKPVEKAKE